MWRLAVALCVLFLTLAAPTDARDHDRARDAVRSGEVRPLGEVLGPVRSRYPGRLLDTQLSRQGNNWVYRIKILDRAGKVRVVIVDARSGRILRAR